MRGVVFMRAFVAGAIAGAVSLSAAQAATGCARGALGTARTIAVDARDFQRIGTTQYSQTLPLDDREVVLTFDDGPISPFTESVLKTLADECVKATFFLVGRQAQAHPELVRAIVAAGHSIGTHSQNHPLTFDQMPLERARAEIDDGIASVTAALGEAPPPFFRIPGFLRSREVEQQLAARNIVLWGTDADADDWYKTATPEDIVAKAIQRLEAKKRGILLLHDVQPATALALPALLKELKARGWRVVHAVPPQPHRPAVAKHHDKHRKAPAARTAAATSWPRTASPRVQQARRADDARGRRAPRVRYLTKREWDEMNRRARYADRRWDPYRR
ncbi:MAG: polysaccharide deacetylase family protein [Xanthobacteraceae bacterium]|uniref:polysaccharide deacetylase family protein n=1 Tax=Pseudolabrys sp. TaxID=1960880 RepID=UPI003D0A5204